MRTDEASATSRLTSEKDFHDRRFKDGDSRHTQLKYYWAVAKGAEDYTLQIRTLAKDADVLEYGCGAEPYALKLTSIARSINAIDISDEAIKVAQAKQPPANLTLATMNAMELEFPDNSFDLVFGAGIVHHLDTLECAREVARVLRPRGQAIFWEPLGVNPMINAYRWLTPQARTPDEHPLLPRDMDLLRSQFSSVALDFYGLTTLASVPLKSSRVGTRVRHGLERVDEMILSVPGLRYLAWYCLIRCVK